MKCFSDLFQEFSFSFLTQKTLFLIFSMLFRFVANFLAQVRVEIGAIIIQFWPD